MTPTGKCFICKQPVLIVAMDTKTLALQPDGDLRGNVEGAPQRTRLPRALDRQGHARDDRLAEVQQPRVQRTGGSMSGILAIDPGNQESAYCLIDSSTRRPSQFGKVPNDELLDILDDERTDFVVCAVEMVAAYGMAVGAEVFETCVWIGRFVQRLADQAHHPLLVKRQPVKLHHCHSAKAKDSNVRQALIDRFGAGASNGGKGTKADPGWFYGFAADVWSAYAIAVFVADQQAGVTP